MPCFYSRNEQSAIKHQIRQILPWEMDCNINVIAPNHRGEKNFYIAVPCGRSTRIYTVNIRPILNGQCFVEIH